MVANNRACSCREARDRSAPTSHVKGNRSDPALRIDCLIGDKHWHHVHGEAGWKRLFGKYPSHSLHPEHWTPLSPPVRLHPTYVLMKSLSAHLLIAPVRHPRSTTLGTTVNPRALS